MGRQKSGISNQEIIIHGNGSRSMLSSLGRPQVVIEPDVSHDFRIDRGELFADTYIDLGSCYGIRRGSYKQCSTDGCNGYCSIRSWHDYTATKSKHNWVNRYNPEEIHLSLPENLEEFKKTYFALARLDGREPLDLSFDCRPGETTSEDMYAY